MIHILSHTSISSYHSVSYTFIISPKQKKLSEKSADIFAPYIPLTLIFDMAQVKAQVNLFIRHRVLLSHSYLQCQL